MTFGDVARLTARHRLAAARPRRGAREPCAHDPGRLAGLPRDVPRRDAHRRRADPGQPDGPARQLRATTSTTATPESLVVEAALLEKLEPGADAAARPGARRQRRRRRAHELRRGGRRRSPTSWPRRPTRTPTTWPSGSTARARPGRPKGVVHPHRDIERRPCDTYARSRPADRAGRPLLLDDQALPRLRARATACRSRWRSARRPSSGQRSARAPDADPRNGRAAPADAVLLASPPSTRAMLKAPTAAQADFSSVRACVSAAEALPAAVQERWRALTGLPILDGIGSTEMLHIYCSNTSEDLLPGTSGRPVPGYELRVVDERRPRRRGPGRRATCSCAATSCATYYWHQREQDAPVHARRLVLQRRPLHPRPPEGYFVYQGPRRRHDQGRRPLGVAGGRGGVPGARIPPCRRRR